MILSFVKKFFFSIFLVAYEISYYKKNIKKIFDKTKNHDVVYFTQTKNHRSGNELKIIHYVQT